MQREYNMQEIIKAIEEASIEIKELIETGDTGKSDQENSTGDTQLKLDIASDIIIERIFKQLPTVKAIVSEEQENMHRQSSLLMKSMLLAENAVKSIPAMARKWRLMLC